MVLHMINEFVSNVENFLLEGLHLEFTSSRLGMLGALL